MPRDDLSIDFVKRMPPVEALDPAMILDDWINQVSNLPEEIRFIQDEITEKDRLYNDCIKTIEERDARIQKWIKAHGSHFHNPKEETIRATIRENYNKADQLAAEKIQLTQRLQIIMDKHLRRLDAQIKMLYDRNEPGFTDPDELPSLLRPSAANHSAPSIRSINPSANPVTAALSPIVNSATPSAVRAANPQVRAAQSQQHISSSAPATPAASIIMNRQARESSAGPGSGVPKRGPRASSALGNLPATSSGLARHSSLGPGTPKGHHAIAGVQRAGSAGPRASTKNVGAGPGRKASTPSAGPGRKKGTPAGATSSKSGLSRVKRVAKNSPSASAESELSDAESGSGDESDSRTGGRGTPAARVSSHKPDGAAGGGGGGAPAPAPAGEGGGSGGGAGGIGGGRVAGTAMVARTKREDDDDDAMDVDDEEGGDDRKYCLCQNVSFGDMVACDNDACPYEWFHWSCVGLKSEPNGTWFCPVCTENMKKKAK
ncbi:Chromatin modification-related protein [Pleurostoma richardsiae]|uniref:Chromatin modification-related protein n=1 Tax=Pleurostoma richardsiae TaxID=41990 RepID=A0AA38RTL4_9PEZI|nr:Chromatin modification-related protein [Pleurostoma richardsiae]